MVSAGTGIYGDLVFHCRVQTNSLEFNEAFQKLLQAKGKDLKGCPFFLLQKFSYFFGSIFYFYILTATGLGGVRVQVS